MAKNMNENGIPPLSSLLTKPADPNSKKSASNTNSQTPVMTPEEKLDLSPWAKYRLFGKFPFKLSIHILLTILMTYHAIAVSSIFDGYNRSIARSWSPLLFPDNGASEEENWGKDYEIYTVNGTLTVGNLLINHHHLMRLRVERIFFLSHSPFSQSIFPMQ